MILILRHRTQSVSNPDADHIGGFLDVFDAFEVESVYASGDPKGTLTYGTFLRAAREEGSRLEMVRAGRLLDWGRRQDRRVGPETPSPPSCDSAPC